MPKLSIGAMMQYILAHQNYIDDIELENHSDLPVSGAELAQLQNSKDRETIEYLFEECRQAVKEGEKREQEENIQHGRAE